MASRSIPTKELKDEIIKEVELGDKTDPPIKNDPPPAPLKTDPPPAPPATPVDQELSDEQLMKLLEKKGIKIVREELTPEQRQQAEAIEKVEKLKFALETGLITAERYDELNAIVSMDETELTKKNFTAEYRKENPNATAQEVEEAYSDYYWVQRNVKVSQQDEEGNEVEVDKPKFDERIVKWGEQRRKKEGELIKGQAKATLDEIDTRYNNSKVNRQKTADYNSTVDKILSGMNFGQFSTKFSLMETGEDGNPKEKVIEDAVQLGNKVNEEVRQYLLDPRIVALVISGDKQKDEAEINKLISGYVRNRYEPLFNARLWALAESEGLNKGKAGIKTPIQSPLLSDNTIDDLEQQARQIRENLDKELPPETLTKRK